LNNVNENNFKFHPATGEKAERHQNVRNACQGLANVIASNCPQSRELSLAMTKIEEAMMWANAGIARN
jgi:hypothetical protein